MKEADIQKQILKYLMLNRVMAWKCNTTGIYDPVRKVFRTNSTRKGIPDILGVLPNGRFLGIEVKMPKGVVSDNQKLFIKEANENGALVFVARSLQDVITTFESLGLNKR